MKRRDFIAALGGVATVPPLSPFVASAQQSMPVVGFVHSTIPLADARRLVTAFREGLKEAGFVEGRNVKVEYQSAEGHANRLRVLIADLLRRSVDVIAGNVIAMLAAKAETTTVPIVFAGGTDAVKVGLVTSLNRPGANVTGAGFSAGALGAKRLALLHQLVPKATTIAVLVNPNTVETEAERRDVQAASQKLGLRLVTVDVGSVRDIDKGFATFVQRGADALFVGAGPFANRHRKRLVALAAQYSLPSSYTLRGFVEAGGLMSYGTSILEAYCQAGVYTGRILKGEKLADLPVIQSSKFEFVINLKTARSLGLEIPPTLLATADEVIE